MQTLIVSWTIITSQTNVGALKTMTLHLFLRYHDICPPPPGHSPSPRHLLPRRLPPDVCPPDICPPKHLPPPKKKLMNNG